MKFFLNFLIFAVFFLVISVATFSPLSLIRVLPSGGFVLGESSQMSGLALGLPTTLSAKSYEVSLDIYPSQKTYYTQVLKLKNQESGNQRYSVEIYDLQNGLTQLFRARAYFGSSPERQTVELRPGEEGYVNIFAEAPEGRSASVIKSRLRLLIWKLN